MLRGRFGVNSPFSDTQITSRQPATRQTSYGPIIFEKMTSSYRQSDNPPNGSISCLSRTQLSSFKNPIGFPVDSQVSFAATFAPVSWPAFWLSRGHLLSFQLSRSFPFVATFATLSRPFRGLHVDFRERSRVKNLNKSFPGGF